MNRWIRPVLLAVLSVACVASCCSVADDATDQNAELVARHEALRESVTTTISQLDALIEGLAP